MQEQSNIIKPKIVLEEGAKMPTRGRNGDACFDLYVLNDTVVRYKSKTVVPTGVRIQLPFNTVGIVKNRSGITLKGCPAIMFLPVFDVETRKFNTIEEERMVDVEVLLGTIDSNYRGTLGIMLKNNECRDILIKKGTKLAQLEIRKIYTGDLEVTDKLDESERNEDSYGSSGTI